MGNRNRKHKKNNNKRAAQVFQNNAAGVSGADPGARQVIPAHLKDQTEEELFVLSEQTESPEEILEIKAEAGIPVQYEKTEEVGDRAGSETPEGFDDDILEGFRILEIPPKPSFSFISAALAGGNRIEQNESEEEAEPELEAEPEPEREQEPEFEAEPEPEEAAEPAEEPEAEPGEEEAEEQPVEPEVEPEAEPEPEAAPEPEFEAESEPEFEAEPEPEEAAEPAEEPEAEPGEEAAAEQPVEPEVEPEAEPEPEREPEPEIEAKPEPEPAPEEAAEPAEEPEAEPEEEAAAEQPVEPEIEPEAEPEVEREPELEAEPEPETAPEEATEPAEEPEAEPEEEAAAEQPVEPEVEPEAEPEPEREQEPEFEAEPGPEPTQEEAAEPAEEPETEPGEEAAGEQPVEPEVEPEAESEPEPEEDAEPEKEYKPPVRAAEPDDEDEDPDVDSVPKAARSRKKAVREVKAERTLPQDEIRSARRATRRFHILFVSEGTKHVRTIRTSLDMLLLSGVLIVLLIAALIAYLFSGRSEKEEYEERIEALNEQITTLSEDKILLQADIESLDLALKEANSKLTEHDTKAQAKTEEEALLYVPSALPLDSQALPSEYDKENKWITMDAAPGARVVATGAGTVNYAGESVEAGGYLVSVDHGNGYVSNYYCLSFPVVKENAKVDRGTALFLIGEDAGKLIYRIQYEGDYIDPYTVLNIAG